MSIFINMMIILIFPIATYCESVRPIRIGATVSRSGKYSEPSSMVLAGYRLWEKQINQRGGLLNRPIELVLYDDQSNPELVYNQYSKLIHVDKVDLVLSPYGTPLTLQASKISETQSMVMLASAASGKSIWSRGYRYVFGMYALADRYFIGLLDLMARHEKETVAIIYEDSPFNIDVANGAETWAKRFGLSILLKKAYPPNSDQLSALIKEALETRAQGLIISAYPTEGYRMLKYIDESDWRPKALGMTIAPIHPHFYTKAGSVAEGVFGPSQWEADERVPFPGTIKFIEDFKSTYKNLPSYHAGSAYATCQILEKAITDLQTIDHTRIRDYIISLDTVTVIGRFKVDQHGKQVGHNPILIQWQNEKKEIVYPTKMQTAKPRF